MRHPAKIAWDRRNRKRRNAASLAWYRRNRDHAKAKSLAWHHTGRWRIKRYGLSPEQYQAMFEEQGGRCALCGRLQSVLVVDHNHATGAVRKLLCSTCNSALGFFLDSPTLLRKAARYIEREP